MGNTNGERARDAKETYAEKARTMPEAKGQGDKVHDEALKKDTLPELAANNFVSTEPAPISNPYEALEGAAETTGADTPA